MDTLRHTLKEGTELRVETEQSAPLVLKLKAGVEDAGTLSFSDAGMSAEFRSAARSFSIRRDRETSKTVVIEHGEEKAFCLGRKLGCKVILTEDSNILLLKDEGSRRGPASLVEYETGCRFLKFTPESGGGTTILKVLVSPIIADAEDLFELLALSLFELLNDEGELHT